MARIKYYYDTETCKYELVLAVIILIISSTYFESPQVSLLKKENKELLLYYNDMQKDLANMDAMLLSLQDRDDNIYRVIFEADPIPSSVRQAGVGGTDRYRALREESLEREDLVLSTLEKIDKLKKQMYIQTKSHDDIEQMARNKSVMMASIPSIQPINNSDLNRLASGYGMRMHPILKYIRMHAGIDFSAPQGTPIFATGDGTVDYAGFSKTSGNMVTLNHGYGYMTKYLHMSNFAVRQGQKVKRGDIIGYVGNTGLSKAPHCHYEVWKDGQHVNPVNFFYNDVTDEEFDKLLELATKENESLG